MKLHPVLLPFMVVADRNCEFCRGGGIYKGKEICTCVQTYYGQPISRRMAQQIKEQLKKFRAEGRYASLRNS